MVSCKNNAIKNSRVLWSRFIKHKILLKLGLIIILLGYLTFFKELLLQLTIVHNQFLYGLNEDIIQALLLGSGVRCLLRQSACISTFYLNLWQFHWLIKGTSFRNWKSLLEIFPFGGLLLHLSFCQAVTQILVSIFHISVTKCFVA